MFSQSFWQYVVFQDVAGEIRSENMGDVQVKPLSLNLDHNFNLNHFVKQKPD